MISVSFDILALIWFLFLLYWTGAFLYEFLTKKSKNIKKRESLPVLLLNRLFIYIAVIILFITPYYEQNFPFDLKIFPNSQIITIIGLVITLIGILFAIWARFTLGNNWSGDADLKNKQILIKSGPYNIVRHPIYTGLTLAVIGSVITENAIIGISAILSILFFSYLRISIEEKLMKVEFGKEYEEYSKTVKRFIPWLR